MAASTLSDAQRAEIQQMGVEKLTGLVSPVQLLGLALELERAQGMGHAVLVVTVVNGHVDVVSVAPTAKTTPQYAAKWLEELAK